MNPGAALSPLVQMDAKGYTIRVIVDVREPRRFDPVRSRVLVVLLTVCALFGPLTGQSTANGPVPMPLVSRGVPAYGSELWWNCAIGCYYSPDNAVDANYSTKFATPSLATPSSPQWLALDLNGKNLGPTYVLIYTGGAYNYDFANTPGYGAITDFTIQASTGHSGTLPTTWTSLASRSGQTLHSFSIAVDLTGYTWFRVLVTGNNNPSGGIDLQVDLHDARGGMDDSFKFFGDSITANCMQPGTTSNFSTLVNAQAPTHYPAFENAGLGFWTAPYLLGKFDAWIANYPGRYVGISLGTNDANSDTSGNYAAYFYSNMLTLVDKALAAGKVPIIPTIPWSSLPQYQNAVPLYNAKIEALYAARPQIIRGPDLWTYFQNNPIYLTSNDGLHPNAAGCAQMQKLWADAMVARVYNGTQPPPIAAGPSPTAAGSPAVALVWGCCGVTTSAAVTPTSVTAGGGSVSVATSVRLNAPATVLVDIETYDPNGTVVFTKSYDGQTFAAGQSRQYTSDYIPAANAIGGTYTVKTGVFAPAWGNLLDWNNSAGTFTIKASGLATPTPGPFAPPAQTAPGALSPLHVSGNRLVNSSNAPVQLHGVNHSGSEYACIQGWGVLESPTDSASLQAMRAWGVNAVRVPLNEDCWLSINGAPAAYSGPTYQQQIADYVTRLGQAGLYTVLELHWSAPGVGKATGQQPMPDADHSPLFWSQVAATFKGNGTVILDLHNEPFPDNNQDTAAAWSCWRDGGSCSGFGYQAAGMQTLVDAVRATGANNVIALGGVQYSNALGSWLAYKPNDPRNNLVASWHVYDFNACQTVSCYDSTVGVVAKSVPVLALEFGSSNCDPTWLGTTMGWFDSHNLGYFAWTWNNWGSACSSLSLISSDAGTPTQWGQIYRTHLTQNAPAAIPTPGPVAAPAATVPTAASPVAVAQPAGRTSAPGAPLLVTAQPRPTEPVATTPRNPPAAAMPVPHPVGQTMPPVALALAVAATAADQRTAGLVNGGLGDRLRLVPAALGEMVGVLTGQSPYGGAALTTVIGAERATLVMTALAQFGGDVRGRSPVENGVALAAVLVGFAVLVLAPRRLWSLGRRALAALLQRRYGPLSYRA